MSEETTLADLLQLNLHKYEDEVRNIVDKAVKESGMEKVPSARGGSCLARGTPRLVLRGGPAPTEPERHLSGASPDGTPRQKPRPVSPDPTTRGKTQFPLRPRPPPAAAGTLQSALGPLLPCSPAAPRPGSCPLSCSPVGGRGRAGP